DLDNDGDLDMMAGQRYGSFKYFQNTGSNTAPAFAPLQWNLFGLVDIADNSYPAFADLDNDGDLDMMAGDDSGNFQYFQNTGTNTAPAFAPAQNNPFGLADIGYRSSPAFADLDNDGDLDMIAGDWYGNFKYFENTGDNANPAFAPAQNNPFGLADIGYYSTPTFVDLDNDGDLDLMAGDYYGNFKYFENTTPPSGSTWDGSTSTAWNVGSNWSTGSVPGASDDVTIPDVSNDPVISGSMTINDVELQSGATLSVNSGGTLTLDGELDNSGAITIQSGGSFLQGASSSITGSGSFSVKRQGGSAFNFWSSPITAQSGVPGTSYTYNSNTSTQDDSDDTPQDPGWSSYNGTMTPGKGYAGSGGGLATFTGTPNNGNVNVPLVYYAFNAAYDASSGAGTPFNLVGNPYPSAISANSFIASNSNIFGTIYFWNDDASGGSGYNRTDFSYWNGTGGLGSTGVGPTPNGNIATGQGFLVRATSAGTLSFNNTQRVAGNNTQFHRVSGEDSRLWFSVENGEIYNEILIGLLEDATEYEDRLYDAVKMKGNPDISLSAKDDDTEYAILAFPPPAYSKTIPLQVEMTETGIYQFTANTMENFDGYDVYFEDVQNNTSVLLQEGVAVPVSLSAGIYTDRFFLNFVRTSLTGIAVAEEGGLTAYAANALLHIRCTECASNATIELLDMSGRLVLQQQKPVFNDSNATVSLTGISTGVYIVRVTADAQTLSQKIVKQ
ncbi:MAG: VCBS repeat-containing protein, partial [Flavobacteriales bacterium]|nr:VCBS repeat-containing protein [Flavobacteriales bacterium]